MQQESTTTVNENVPVGFGTYLGLSGTLIAFAMAIIAFIEGDRSEETIGPLVVGGLVLYGTIKGRMDQASAKTLAKGQIIAASVTATSVPSTNVAGTSQNETSPGEIDAGVEPGAVPLRPAE